MQFCKFICLNLKRKTIYMERLGKFSFFQEKIGMSIGILSFKGKCGSISFKPNKIVVFTLPMAEFFSYPKLNWRLSIVFRSSRR